MTIKQAVEIFKRKYPDKKPIGYWINGASVILNIRPEHGPGYSEVCQYEVFDDGRVQATNPMRSEVIINTVMTRLL